MSITPTPPESAAAAQVVRDLALSAAEPIELTPGKIYAVHTPRGVERIDLYDVYRDEPRHKAGTVIVTDVDSFITYHEKHADSDTELYADQDAATVTAVLDAHRSDGARYGMHRLILRLQPSKSFTAWVNSDRHGFSQVGFAEWIEDHLADIRSPAGAELLEIAQTFHANAKTAFKSGYILTSGQRQLVWQEEITAKAGTSGSLTIPESFTLALEVYDGMRNATGARVLDTFTARLRYRVKDSELSMLYVLDRPEDVVRTAFDAVTTKIEQSIERHVLRGVPIDAGVF